MNRVRMYIADHDTRFIDSVRGFVPSCGHPVEIVGTATSGDKALEEITRLRPDVLVTALSMPGIDGITLLRHSRRLRCPPSVIICTRFCSRVSMECAGRYGASFYVCKPLELENLIRLALECGPSKPQPQEPQDAEGDRQTQARVRAVRELLKNLGIPSRLSGSAYIIEAVSLLDRDGLLLRNLSHGLYAEIARRMDTTVPRVERALRSAIAIAHERGRLAEIFPRRPSNKEFLEFVMRTIDEPQQASE